MVLKVCRQRPGEHTVASCNGNPASKSSLDGEFAWCSRLVLAARPVVSPRKVIVSIWVSVLNELTSPCRRNRKPAGMAVPLPHDDMFAAIWLCGESTIITRYTHIHTYPSALAFLFSTRKENSLLVVVVLHAFPQIF